MVFSGVVNYVAFVLLPGSTFDFATVLLEVIMSWVVHFQSTIISKPSTS